MGCMAQRLGPALLEQAPQVDLVVGPDGYRKLPELIGHGARRASGSAIPSSDRGSTTRTCPPVRENGPDRFVTVQRGCDYRCTFCIVPYTRGPERSRKLADVVREVASLVERGITEVTLLGQTVNCYHDGDARFRRSAARRRRGGRAFGGSGSPARIPTISRDRVIAAMAETPRCASTCTCRCRADRTRSLKRMLRRYTREGYLEVVAELRRAIPGIDLDHRHHRRLSRRDRRGIRGDARAGARSRLRRRVHVQVLAARGNAGGPPRDHVPDESRRNGCSG